MSPAKSDSFTCSSPISILLYLFLLHCCGLCYCLVTQLCLTLQPPGLQHDRPPYPSPTPGAYLNSRLLSWWCHPAIPSSIVPFSSCLQSYSVSGSFPVNQFLTSGGQSIGVSASASVLLMNIQDWFPLGWTDWISLQSKDSQESSLTPQFKTSIL